VTNHDRPTTQVSCDMVLKISKTEQFLRSLPRVFVCTTGGGKISFSSVPERHSSSVIRDEIYRTRGGI